MCYDNAPHTFISNSIIDGKGLFASKNFEEGELVLDYSLFSNIWVQTTYDCLSPERIARSGYVMLDESNCIFSTSDTKFRYVNHSRNSNCSCDFYNRKIHAIRLIPKGEEILIDYRKEPKPLGVPFPPWV